MRGDRRDPELDRLRDERVADMGKAAVAVIEAPGVSGAVVEIRVVREHLPGDDAIALRRRSHGVEVGGEVADVGERLPVQEDALVVTQGLGETAGLVHELGRHRAAFGRDRQGRQDHHRRVALEEHLLHEMRDREAQPLVLLAAATLGEPGPEVAGLTRGRVDPVLEEVPLDVEHELVPRQRGARRVAVGARGGRDVVTTAGLASALRLRFLAGAGVEHEQRRRGAAHREQEPPSRHAGTTGVAVTGVPGSPDRLLDDRRERSGVVLAVRARPELDR